MDGLDRLIQFWYVTLPKVLSPLMPRLATAVSDGGWTAAWRVPAAWAPVIVFVAGCFVPRSWPGAHDIYTESLLFLAVAVSLGIVSGTLGVALLLANGVREALSRDVASSLSAVTHVGAGQLVAWLLLGVLVVVLPQFTHLVTEAAITRLRFLKRTDARAVVRSLLLAVVYAAVVLVWCLAATVLLQPVFTWSGRPPSVESVAVLSGSWKWLLAAAAGAALARGLVEGVVAPRAWLSPHVAALTRERHEAMGRAGAVWDGVPDVARSALAGSGVGLLLSGLSHRFTDGLAAGAFFFLLSFVARRPRGWLTGRWSDLVRIVPGAIRVGLALGLGYLVSERMPTLALSWVAERSALIGATLTLALFVLLFPADDERLRPSRARSSRRT